MNTSIDKELVARAYAVKLILEGRVEEALVMLSRFYGIPAPGLKIGLPKRYSRALGCYVARRRTIYLRSSSEYSNPYVILHEFYHHLRTFMGKHRGTEKHADLYALESIRYYNQLYSTYRFRE